jgi:hypothetical protein
LDAAVVYIDTEKKLSERRLVQIMQWQLALYNGYSMDASAQIPEELVTRAAFYAQRIHILRPDTGAVLSLAPIQSLMRMERG